MVKPPTVTLAASCTSYYVSAALRVAFEANVVEIIREAVPQELHVDKISEKCGLDSEKLARVLRTLASHHIFRETSPNTFANNRLSSLIDTQKPVKELFSRPLEKYDGTNGISALIAHCADGDAKGAAYLWETLSDIKTGHSEEPNRSSMCRAFGISGTVWSWLEAPGNELPHRRFGAAIYGANSFQPVDGVLHGFKWDRLAHGSTIVDIGGGIGVSSLAIAKKYSHLKLIIQDRETVVKQGVKHWEDQLPEALESKRVIFESHNFFDEQPIKDAAVFVVKQITHSWSDVYATRILRRLRDAAQPHTILMIIDNLIPYACRDRSSDGSSDAPPPLLASWPYKPYALLYGFKYVGKFQCTRAYANPDEEAARKLWMGTHRYNHISWQYWW